MTVFGHFILFSLTFCSGHVTRHLPSAHTDDVYRDLFLFCYGRLDFSSSFFLSTTLFEATGHVLYWFSQLFAILNYVRSLKPILLLIYFSIILRKTWYFIDCSTLNRLVKLCMDFCWLRDLFVIAVFSLTFLMNLRRH